jgi:hypothetical protein
MQGWDQCWPLPSSNVACLQLVCGDWMWSACPMPPCEQAHMSCWVGGWVGGGDLSDAALRFGAACGCLRGDLVWWEPATLQGVFLLAIGL